MNNSDNKDSNLDSQRCQIYDINEKLSNACNDGYNKGKEQSELITEDYCFNKYNNSSEITSCYFGMINSKNDNDVNLSISILKNLYNP